jgi:hypothetical protein
MNNELSHELKSAFPSIIPAPRPKVGGQEIKDPNWLAGFASGEGCFDIKTSKSSTHKLGLQVKIRFSLTQHYRDNELIKSLITYLGCGNVEVHTERLAVNFVVSRFSDITEKIIPFFDKYPCIPLWTILVHKGQE